MEMKIIAVHTASRSESITPIRNQALLLSLSNNGKGGLLRTDLREFDFILAKLARETGLVSCCVL